MLEAICHIEADMQDLDFDSFCGNRRVRQLVERNLEVISEASRRLPDEIKAREQDVPWPQIAGIGNIIRHEYHQVMPTALWATCQKDLKQLKEALLRIKQALDF
jgi:uncharacterized protein with HEPN domain